MESPAKDVQNVAPQTPAPRYQLLPINKIRTSPHQARKDFDDAKLQSLAKSMASEGLDNPVTARPLGDGTWELIAGERRLRAAKLLGWETIEAKIVEPINEASACAKGIVENVQREDLNPIEEAEAFKEQTGLDLNHWTQVKMAEIFGKSQSDISKSLRFLGFSDRIKENIRRRIILSGHAEELLRLPTPKLQEQVAKKIEAGLSVMQTRNLVDKLLKHAKDPAKIKMGRPALDPCARLWVEVMSNPHLPGAGEWNITFKKGTWNFAVYSTGSIHSQETLADWFTKVGESLRNANPSGDPSLSLSKAKIIEAPTARGADKPVATPSVFFGSTPRFPQNLQEEAELEAKAVMGPWHVYAWIFGPDSQMAKMVEGKTWQDFQIQAPKEGLKKVLDGIQELLATTQKAGK